MTLLPLLRRTLLLVMISLVILSEAGIDIAPLLASAVVIGLAIGFGAQTLVQDVIAGQFILIEDTIAVRDYVEVFPIREAVDFPCPLAETRLSHV